MLYDKIPKSLRKTIDEIAMKCIYRNEPFADYPENPLGEKLFPERYSSVICYLKKAGYTKEEIFKGRLPDLYVLTALQELGGPGRLANRPVDCPEGFLEK